MNTTFGEYVKLKRAEKSLSKSELARRIGITPQYVTDIEDNRTLPNEEKISKLAEVLDGEEREMFMLADKLPLRIIEKAKRSYYKGKIN